MNSRTILALSAITVVFAMLSTSSQAEASIDFAHWPIFVKIDGVIGDSTITTKGYDDGKWFVADSFSFGVEREMKESGEKGGTADINIGIGELQEATISKSMDVASAQLAQLALNGNSCGIAEIDFVEVAGGYAGEQPIDYLKYKLDRCFVKSWSISGDADDRPTEEVAFYYNKIAFAYSPMSVMNPTLGASWDVSGKKIWSEVTNLVDEIEPNTCEEICQINAKQVYNNCVGMLAEGEPLDRCQAQAAEHLRACQEKCDGTGGTVPPGS